MVLGLELAASTDEALMLRVKAREYPAFVTLFDRYRPNAVTFAVRMLGDADEAERLVHLAFVQLAKQAASYNPEKIRFRLWFFSALSKLVSKQASAASPGGPGGGGGLDRLEKFTALGHVSDTSSVASRADEVRSLLQGLGRLNPVYREVVYLRRFEKMSYEDIARVTGEKPATVKSRMNYAVEQLRKALHKRI